MKKTKIKSTKQFNKNNEIKPVYLGEIDYSILMYDKESIDNISSNLSIDYTEKNTLLSNEIFTKINLLSSRYKTDFNNLSNLIAKNIDFIQAISVDLSDDISNIVEFNNKISTLNISLNELSNLHKEDIKELSSSLEITNNNISELSNRHSLEIETLEQEISTLNNTFETFENELNNKILDLVDADGKIFEDKLPDRIIKIINDLSDATDLNDAPGIINFLSKKIDTDITNLSNEFNSEIFNIKTENFDSIYEIYNVINDLSGSVSQDIEKLYNDLSDEIQNVNDAIIDLSDGLSNEVFILNSKINNLNDEFNSEIADVKIENINYISEIYDAINDLSGSITQDIKNLYYDLSDEIQSVNDAIFDLSDGLFELSNSINNSIETYINNRIVDESDNGLVTNEILNEKINIESIIYEISSDSQVVDLIPNTAHLIKIKSANTTANLQLPFYSYVDKNNQRHNLKPYENILVMIENNTNESKIKYNLLTDETTTTLIYTESGMLSNTISDYSAALIKAEYNKPFWFTHHHAYKRITDNKLTIIFSGENQQSSHNLYNSTYSFTILGDADGYFRFSLADDLSTVTYNNKTETLPDKWKALYGNAKCTLKGWTTNLRNSTFNPEINSAREFIYNINDYKGDIITFYPIYNLHEIDITDITITKTKVSSAVVATVELNFTNIINSSILNGNKGIIFNAQIKGNINPANNDFYLLKARYNYPSVDYVQVDAYDTNGNIVPRATTFYLASASDPSINTRTLEMWCKSGVGSGEWANYSLTVEKIKIGYNRFNHPTYNVKYDSW